MKNGLYLLALLLPTIALAAEDERRLTGKITEAELLEEDWELDEELEWFDKEDFDASEFLGDMAPPSGRQNRRLGKGGSYVGRYGPGGSGSKGSKGGYGGTVIRVSYKKKDLKKGAESIEGDKGTEIGLAINQIMLYGRNGASIGFLTETDIATEDDCTIQGAFSIDPVQSRAANQIFYQGTCSSARAFAITGGTGRFNCASGYARMIGKGKSRVVYDLYVWYTC